MTSRGAAAHLLSCEQVQSNGPFSDAKIKPGRPPRGSSRRSEPKVTSFCPGRTKLLGARCWTLFGRMGVFIIREAFFAAQEHSKRSARPSRFRAHADGPLEKADAVEIFGSPDTRRTTQGVPLTKMGL